MHHLSAWRWILWNLLLAAVPVAAGYTLAIGAARFTLRQRRVPWVVWAPLAALWLAFLPNTCYLLTEWRHFLFDPPMPALIARAEADRSTMLGLARWGLFYLLYSGAGVLCFVLAVRPMERLARQAGLRLWLLALLFFFLASLGVYLGLIARLNSWDVTTRPAYVLEVVRETLSNPAAMEAVVVFAGFLWLVYQAVNIWVDGVLLRVRRGRVLEAAEPREAVRP